MTRIGKPWVKMNVMLDYDYILIIKKILLFGPNTVKCCKCETLLNRILGFGCHPTKLWHHQQYMCLLIHFFFLFDLKGNVRGEKLQTYNNGSAVPVELSPCSLYVIALSWWAQPGNLKNLYSSRHQLYLITIISTAIDSKQQLYLATCFTSMRLSVMSKMWP